jgi:chromosome segregation ATPase
MRRLLILACVLLGTSLGFGQTTLQRVNTNAKSTTAGIEFQKKYIKQLRSQWKANKDLLNFIEKESRKVDFQKRYSRNLKAQLKRSEASLDEVKELLKKWEDQLSSLGDDAQLVNIDLQNALQKQQQTLQTMSNVSKMLHDTAMAIIRKIG